MAMTQGIPVPIQVPVLYLLPARFFTCFKNLVLPPKMLTLLGTLFGHVSGHDTGHLPDMTGHVSGHDRTGSDSIMCANVQNVQVETGHPGHILDIPDISDTRP